MRKTLVTLAVMAIAAIPIVAISTNSSSGWSTCWLGINQRPPHLASNNGIIWTSEIRCNTNQSITAGGELWDATLGQEIDGTNGNPPETNHCNSCTYSSIGDGITTVNSLTAAGSSCLSGHTYVIWAYGWVSGIYKQQEFGPYGPIC